MPLALTIIFVFPFSKKIRLGLELRKKNKLKSPIRESPLWIHASSGEFEYAKPIITEWAKSHPEIPIIVTYYSPSYAEVIKNFPGVNMAIPLPLDLPGPTRSFIKKMNPRALVVARTDLWPELLLSANQLKIPTLLFSCTFRPLRGFRRLLRPYYRMLFDYFTSIFTASEEDSQNIKKSRTSAQVLTVGDTRYDQVLARLKSPRKFRRELFEGLFLTENFKLARGTEISNSIDTKKSNLADGTTPQTTPLLIAGSTWPEDEEILLQTLLSVRDANTAYFKLILVPHEPTSSHIESLKSSIEKRGFSSTLYSSASAFDADVMIVDQTGLLAELYTIAHFAFVGGSFKSKVHSVMEPLAAGRPTFVGPFFQNNREAIQFQNVFINEKPLIRAVTAVQNTLEFARGLQQHIQFIRELPQMERAIQSEVLRRSGSTSKVLSWIEDYAGRKT